MVWRERRLSWFRTALLVCSAGCLLEVAKADERQQLSEVASVPPALRGGRSLQGASNDTATTVEPSATTVPPVVTAAEPAVVDTTGADTATSTTPITTAFTATTSTTTTQLALPAAGTSSIDPLVIAIPICAGVVFITSLFTLYCFVLYRQRLVQEAYADVFRLEEMEQDYEEALRGLAKNMDLFTSKWDAMLTTDPKKTNNSSKYSMFVQKWETLSKDSKRFLDAEYTPAYRLRTTHLEVCREGSTTVSGVSMCDSQARQVTGGVWPRMPSTPHQEVKRQLKVLGDLNGRLRKTYEEFQDLRSQVFPGGLESAEELPELSKPEDLKPDPRLDEEIALIKPFAHPLLNKVVVKPYDVLGVVESGPRMKPRTKVSAVVADPAGWSHIGKSNNPKGATAMSAVISEWLGLAGTGNGNAVYPPPVHHHFNTTCEVDAEKKAKFHSYDGGMYVVHVVTPKVFEVLQGLYDLSHAYLNVLTEFCRATEGPYGASNESIPRVLRLMPFSVAQMTNKRLEQHMGEVTFSALCMAFAMCPPALHAQLRDSTIEVCLSKRRDFKLYEEALDRRKACVSSKPKLLGDAGRVERRYGSYDWVRQKNAPSDRLQRLCAMLVTQQATCSEGYFLDGKQVELHPKDMLASTRLVLAPNPQTRTEAPATKISHGGTTTTVMEAAIQAHSSGKKTVAVNAASAYSVGGGVLTGGRHALEETWCMVSTLLGSLQKIQWEQLQVRRKSMVGDSLPMHIPVDGCIVSPGVEIFRDTSGKGYPFHNSGYKILGVCSVAMFNMNPRVRDSPQDAPRDFPTYCKQVKSKFHAVLKACHELGAEVLVCPDVGCGVFENDPEIIGSLFGEALRESPTKITEIVITGKDRFYSACCAAAKGGQAEYKMPQYFSDNVTGHNLPSPIPAAAAPMSPGTGRPPPEPQQPSASVGSEDGAAGQKAGSPPAKGTTSGFLAKFMGENRAQSPAQGAAPSPPRSA